MEEKEQKGSWWTTLPGVLTGLAGLLTAIGGLIAALHEAGFLKPLPDRPAPISPEPQRASDPAPHFNGTLSAPTPAFPEPPGTSAQVEGVKVKIVTVQRVQDRDAMFIDLDYQITTGSDFVWHDPFHFVRLISGSAAVGPVWSSAPATSVSPNSRRDVLARFPPPPEGTSLVVFRFGEERHLDLQAQLRN